LELNKIDLTTLKILGLVTVKNDYQVSWKINGEFGFQLNAGNSIASSNPNSLAPAVFSTFHFDDEESLIFYRLFSNKSENQILFKQFRHFDFFFQIQGEIPPERFNEIKQKLRSIKDITAVIPIEIEKFRLSERKIFR
jgi:hypothetical protein